MRCEKVQRLISLWLDGMLSENEEHEMTAHLQNCERCKRVLDEWQQIRAMLRSYPSVALSPEFDRKILSRLKTRKISLPPIPSHWLTNPVFRIASSAMGGLVVMALTLLTLMLSSREPLKQNEQMPHWQWHGLGREFVQMLDIELRGEPQWQSGSSSSSSLSPSHSSRC